jgi:hypothetical protein
MKLCCQTPSLSRGKRKSEAIIPVLRCSRFGTDGDVSYIEMTQSSVLVKKKNVTSYWNAVAPWSPVEVCQCFRGVCFLQI